jgi:hypothetical protein
MAQNFTEDVVLHRHIRLAPDMIAKLRLDHTEGALNVRALMIVSQELLAIEGEVVEHFLPEPPAAPLWMLLKAIYGVASCAAITFVLFTLE